MRRNCDRRRVYYPRSGMLAVWIIAMVIIVLLLIMGS